MPRDCCWTCRRPKCVCLCEHIKKHAASVRFVILAHPNEARSKMSTGYLAHLSLAESVYIEDYDFKQCRELEDILQHPSETCYLLFPSSSAIPLPAIKTSTPTIAQTRTNIIVIEGTWSQARVILAKSEKLRSLPHLTLNSTRSSRFKIRTQPDPTCLSTIEAIGYALRDLGDFSDERTEEFLSPFLTLVERQINYQKTNSPRYRRKWEHSL
jgi:DTW domain-containing protein YfiP